MRINTIFFCSLLGVVYVLCPILIMIFAKDDKKSRLLKNLILSSFLVLLMIGIIADIDFTKDKIYIGFDFSAGFFNKSIILSFSSFKTDIYLNLLMLIPVGQFLFLFVYDKLKFKGIIYALLIGLCIGCIIELLQFVLPVMRMVQLQDVLLNGVSCVLGYVFMMIIYYIFNLIRKK